MIPRTPSLKKAENKIKEATLHLKILAQYEPNDSQVETYIYAFQNATKRYDTLKETMETAEDKYDFPEQMDEAVIEAADDVICSIKAFYNDIGNYKEYEKKIDDEERA